MTRYEEKRQRRIERYEELAEKNDAICAANGLDIFSEEKSGIPLGQPILVGHHSERRHRNHIARLEKRVEKGIKAGQKADYYRSKARAAENNASIMSDDPEAVIKIKNKIKTLEESIAWMKKTNAWLRSMKTYDNATKYFERIGGGASMEDLEILRHLVRQHKFYAYPPQEINRYYYSTTSSNAEIKRLKKRLVSLQRAESFEDFEVNGIKVINDEGQIQVHFQYKPDTETRSKLKKYPLSLKWSRYSTAWVRKFTASTDKYFFDELRKVLEGAHSE